jgi:molecular chaperone HtpG
MPRAEHKEMTFDFDGLIRLLAGHLYSEKKVFIRELIQNAHDAIQRRAAMDPEFDLGGGRIDILTDLATGPGRIVFRDNGVGMTEGDLEEFLSTIGKSGTLQARETDHVPDVIGQFGIGFLSGFVVGSKVEVRTRHMNAGPEGGCLWENDGRKEYTISPCRRESIGTEVVVHLHSAEDRGLLHDDAVKKVVQKYADLLRIPIHLNDPAHRGHSVNTRHMPWERVGVPDDEMRLDCMIYLEKTVPDSVLEVIPVHEKGEQGVNIAGLLYITRTRVVGRDAPRVLRVFQKRMFLCEDAKDLLPSWATFVNGILNTPDLSPNAARDNFARDGQFERLRSCLGDLIVRHFEHLKDKEPARLSEILAYHDLAIKSACHYYAPFFEKFGHLLEWRINKNSPAARRGRIGATARRSIDDDSEGSCAWATLPDIIAALPDDEQHGPKRVPCFQQSSSANQYFDMADAANATVVDASLLFDADLLKSYADKNRTKMKLVYVDREDDLFKNIDPKMDEEVQRLAQVMSILIRPGGTGRVHVEARRFDPPTLPAVLKYNEAGEGSMKARSILTDPNTPSDLKKMAEDMIKLTRNADMQMMINAGNELVRKLAHLDSQDEDVRDLMLGIYNDAILYNAALMTPRNARLFHEQFQRLIARSIEFVHQKVDIARAQAELFKERESRRPRGQQSRQHKVAFLMMPYATEFKNTREAIRIVVEDRLGCELRAADEKTYAQFIHGSVKAHIDDADIFIADVTGQNPNVMLELGAVLYGGRSAPTLLVARVKQKGDRPDLPADLQGAIAAVYLAAEDISQTADRLVRQFDQHQQLAALLPPESRERYVSEESIEAVLRQNGIMLPPAVQKALSRGLPTRRAWEQATEDEVSRLLGAQHEDLARSVLKRVRQDLPK